MKNITEIFQQIKNLRRGELSTLTMEDISFLEQHEKTGMDVNTDFRDVGVQPYIDIAERANDLRFLLTNPPPRPAEDDMKWQKGWGSRGEWFWEEVKA